MLAISWLAEELLISREGLQCRGGAADSASFRSKADYSHSLQDTRCRLQQCRIQL
jgi:hypothetical protein